jgi:phage portal protein BeeE
MPEFKSALDSTRRASEAGFQRALHKASSRSSALQTYGGGAVGTSRAEGESRRQKNDARQLLAHFRDQVYTSIRPIAQRIAGQPIRLAKIARSPKGRQQRITQTRQFEMPTWLKGLATGLKGGEDIQVIDQHEILDALNRPAPSLPGSSDWFLKYFTVANLELTGHAYWWFIEEKGKREIWPLPSSWVRPVHDGPSLFVGWEMQCMGIGEFFQLAPEEITQFWYPNPENPLLGLGPMQACGKSIMAEEQVVEAQKRSMQLGIHPSALIKVGSGAAKDGKSVPPRLKNFQTEQITQAIKSRYVGLMHFGEPLLLDRLIESVTPYGNKPVEMDFGMNADKARERVEQGFGTNPYTAGAAGLSSRAESAESDRHFVGNTVNPKIELLSRVMTISVLPHFDTSGQFLLFIEPARANDAEMEQREHETGLKFGAETINEYRTQVLRLPPVPGGDVVLVPQNYQYATIGQTIAKPIPSGGIISPSEPVDQTPADTEDPDSESAAESEGDEPPKAHHVATKAFDDAFYDSFAETWLKAHGEQEASMADAVEAFFAEQGDDVSSKLEALGDDDSATADSIISKAFDATAWDTKFREAIRQPFGKAVATGAKQELDAFSEPSADKAVDIGIGFDFGVDLPADVLEAVNKAVDKALSKDYWSDIQETTKDQLETALKNGLEAGEPIRDISKRIKDDVFQGDISKERAKTIARSESTCAMNAGQDAARQKLADEGVVEGKEWFATFDGHTRHTHLTANGQRRPVNEDFDVGGYPAKYPGDPALPASQRINCRCASASVTVFTKRVRSPLVKSFSTCACEVHGQHHPDER